MCTAASHLAKLRLEDGRRLEAKLVIGADGAKSQVKEKFHCQNFCRTFLASFCGLVLLAMSNLWELSTHCLRFQNKGDPLLTAMRVSHQVFPSLMQRMSHWLAPDVSV